MISLSDSYEVPRASIAQLKNAFGENRSQNLKILIEALFGQNALQILCLKPVRNFYD